MNNLAKLLTKGLLSGYAGGSSISSVERDSFVGKQSHVEFPEGIYHDEWFAQEVGGGQELVQVGSESFTRVYAGGTVEKSILDTVGISSEEVITYLIKKVSELSDKTRLFSNYLGKVENDWRYNYTVIDQDTTLQVTVGKEEIAYKEKVVFIHWFILSPVR